MAAPQAAPSTSNSENFDKYLCDILAGRVPLQSLLKWLRLSGNVSDFENPPPMAVDAFSTLFVSEIHDAIQPIVAAYEAARPSNGPEAGTVAPSVSTDSAPKPAPQAPYDKNFPPLKQQNCAPRPKRINPTMLEPSASAGMGFPSGTSGMRSISTTEGNLFSMTVPQPSGKKPNAKKNSDTPEYQLRYPESIIVQRSQQSHPVGGAPKASPRNAEKTPEVSTPHKPKQAVVTTNTTSIAMATASHAELLEKVKPVREQLRALSCIYSAILLQRHSISLSQEIGLIFRYASIWLAGTTVAQTPPPRCISSFPTVEAVKFFGCFVLLDAWQLIRTVGHKLLWLLLEDPVISSAFPELAKNIEDWEAQLRSRKHKYIPPMLGSKSPEHHYSMQYRGDLNHAKGMSRTQHETALLNNREKIRDLFLGLVRDALLNPADYRTGTQLRGADMWRTLIPNNYTWFSDLFVEQMLKVCSWRGDEAVDSSSTRPKADASKIRKLNQRLGSASASKSQQTSSSEYKHAQSTRSGRMPTHPGAPRDFRDEPLPWVSNPVEALFNDREMIFYTLIASGNNYIFMQLLMRTLRAKLFLFLQFSTLEHLHEGDVALGITGGFADRVHSAKVVAKFLSLILHWPYLWDNPLANDTAISMNQASDSPPSSIDLLSAIEWAKSTSSLSLNIPWVTEFMKIYVYDSVTVRSAYVQQALESLRAIYSADELVPASPKFNANRMIATVLLEGLFKLLRINPDRVSMNKPDATQAQSSMLQPEAARFGRLIGGAGIRAKVKVDDCITLIDNDYIEAHAMVLNELHIHLRQVQLRSTISLELTNLARGANSATLSHVVTKKITPVQASRAIQPAAALESAQDQLRRLFFWQYPELYTLCEFVSKKIAANAEHEALFSVPILVDSQLNSRGWNDISTEQVTTFTNELMTSIFEQVETRGRNWVAEKLPQALALLIPAGTLKNAADSAVALSKEYTISRFSEVMRDRVRESISSHLRTRASMVKKKTRHVTFLQSQHINQYTPVKEALITLHGQLLDMNRDFSPHLLTAAQKEVVPSEIRHIALEFYRNVDLAMKLAILNIIQADKPTEARVSLETPELSELLYDTCAALAETGWLISASCCGAVDASRIHQYIGIHFRGQTVENEKNATGQPSNAVKRKQKHSAAARAMSLWCYVVSQICSSESLKAQFTRWLLPPVEISSCLHIFAQIPTNEQDPWARGLATVLAVGFIDGWIPQAQLEDFWLGLFELSASTNVRAVDQLRKNLISDFCSMIPNSHDSFWHAYNV